MGAISNAKCVTTAPQQEISGIVTTDKEASRVIGFPGELREKRDYALLNAYTQVNKKDSATFVIIGDVRAGEDEQIFEEFKLSNPDARIVVTGFIHQDDLPAYYSFMDVFVHPSLRDGFSIR